MMIAGKIATIFVVAALLASSISVLASDNAGDATAKASGSWKQSSDADFNGGTRVGNDTVIKGSSSEATLLLASDSNWKQIRPADSGDRCPGRLWHAASFDEKAEVMVVFGGSGATMGNDTWVYSIRTNNWINQNPKSAPQGRYGHAMVYVPDIGATILFGGFSILNYKPFNDTWAYDIATNTWQNKTQVHSPPARGCHAVAYDSDRKVVVLFGGGPDFSNAWNDTWEYNPATNKWAGPFFSSKPLAKRADHSMVYDPQAHRCVLFGGVNPSTGLYMNDTWEYNGTWVNMPVNPSPQARAGQAMFYDAAKSRVMIFGGGGSSPQYNDIWCYVRGQLQWSKLLPISPQSPPQVYKCRMVYDAQEARSILFGGLTSSFTEMGDVWTFDSENLWWNNNTIRPWGGANFMVERKATGSLVSVSYVGLGTFSFDAERNTWTALSYSSNRQDPAVVYSPLQDKLILFGGYVPSTYYNQTWEFNFTSSVWSNLGITHSPPTRYRHAMAYDETTGLVVLFGGMNGGGRMADTWLFNPALNQWDEPGLMTPPIPRNNHSIVSVPQTGKVVMFGGRGDSGLLNDTEIYNITKQQWTQVSPAHSPPAREGHSMAYDAVSNNLVMFGGKGAGNTYYNDTWEYNVTANTWTEIKTKTAPSQRTRTGIAYCGMLGATVAYGGVTTFYFDDAWVYPAHRNIGTFISSKWDTHMSLLGAQRNPGLNYNKVWWNSSAPFGSLRVQLRTAPTQAGLDTALWYGPTSTSDWYVIPGTPINSVHKDAGARWVQYRLLFNTSNPATTPLLMDITITYSGDPVVPDFATPPVAVVSALVLFLAIAAVGRKRKLKLKKA